MRRFAIIVLTSAMLLAPAATAQAKPEAVSSARPKTATPKIAGDSAMWLENAKVLTTETLEGSSRMPWYKQSLTLARLAELWWKDDPRQARQWLESSIAALGTQKQNEDTQISIGRLYAAESAAEIASHLDPHITDKLLDNILKQLPEILAKAPAEEKGRLLVLTQQLGSFGMITEADKPERDAKIARTIMRLDSDQAAMAIFQPLMNIYGKDPQLGDQLVMELLELIDQGQLKARVLGNLPVVLFPGSTDPHPWKVGGAVVEHYRSTAFNSVMAAQAAGLNDDNCNDALTFSQQLRHFLPQQQTEMKPVLEMCLQGLQKGKDDPTADLGTQDFESADDYLKAADEATNIETRVRYKYWAAAKLMYKSPERALGLLDGMSDDERKALPRYSVGLREDLESILIGRWVKEKDYYGLQSLIDRSPQPAQTAMHIAFEANSRKDTGYASSLLSMIRKLQVRDPVSNPFFYPELIQVFAQLSRPEAPTVLLESLKAIESFPELLPEDKRPKELKSGDYIPISFWNRLRPAPFPDLIDVIDQRLMRLEIDQMKFDGERTSMRLWLLRGELKTYEAALQSEHKRQGEPKPSRVPSATARENVK